MPAATRTVDTLPPSHLDLLDRPVSAALTTELPDGRLQCSVVWVDREDDYLLINTMREFRKARNMRARPRATVLVMDPASGDRWIEIRAGVTAEDRDALAHLDALCRRYTGATPYFGVVVPAELAAVEHPVLFRLTPVAVCTQWAGPAGRARRWGVGPERTAGATATEEARKSAATSTVCGDEPTIPDDHRDLLQRPIVVALSTRLPGGAAQTQPVWCSLDDNDVLVNTTRQRRKGRNLAADGRATVLAVDPDDDARWIEIRGDVTLSEAGALAHLDQLTRRYTGYPHFYGGVYPAAPRPVETRVIARIHPRRIVCDAIH